MQNVSLEPPHGSSVVPPTAATEGVPRGPAQLPCHVTGPDSLKRMLDENDVMIEMLTELQEGRCPVERRVPLLSRLQRNLLYLALLADQNTSAGEPAAATGQQASAGDPNFDWTPDELMKLRESMREQQANVPPGVTVEYDVTKLTESLGGSKTLAQVQALIESIQPSQGNASGSQGI
ncbi:hypothetical protein FOZ61_006671 [Perkinsus olseni]|uniref:SS18 N-terminal domain-containing protein n=1 Tax=Perkinsus olseni TaxID=32597 RepID=A0A7J6LC22_PEROL|nr:hypothetical protein FOZ61_006671 [Perkinsus olseni]